MRHLPLTAAFLLSCAVLAACGGGPSTVNPPVYTAPNSITGTLKNWTAGAGTVTAVEGTTSLSTAPLTSGGTFALTLPSGADVTPYLTTTTGTDFTGIAGCTGAVTVSDPTAQSYFLSTLNARAGSTTKRYIAATVTTSTSGTTTSILLDGRNWVYTDRDFRLSGSATCTSTSDGSTVVLSITTNAQLKAGWNVLQVKVMGTSASNNITLSLNNVVDGPTVWEESTASVTTASQPSAARSLRHYASELLRLTPLR